MKEFDSVLKFAEHLLVLDLEKHVAEERGLKKACEIIEKDCREQIGHYQAEHGHFPAWAPLAESTEDDKAAHGYKLEAPLLRDGELRDSFQHQIIRHDEAIVGSVDPVLEYHEFGTSKMPPRPVVGPALYKNHDKIEHEIGKAFVEAIVGGEITESVLHQMKD